MESSCLKFSTYMTVRACDKTTDKLFSVHEGEKDTDFAILPECPSDVCVRPNFSGGLYVLWNPVR